MKPRSIVVLLVMLSCCAGNVVAQSSISPLAQTLATPVSDWSAQDLQTLRQALLQAGGTIESDLIAAFNDGPSASTLASISGNVSTFTSMQAWLSANSASAGDAGSTLASILAQTPQQLAQAQATLYAVRYRSNALISLAAIAGPTGKALLRTVANNPRSPFQSVAQGAMADSFSDLWVAYEARSSSQFNAQAVAVLSPGRAVDPSASDVILHVGSLVALIPSGSFVAQGNDLYKFVGSVTLRAGGSVSLNVLIAVIKPLPRAAKNIGPTLLVLAEGAGVDLSSVPAPVQAGLLLGSTGGSTTALQFGSPDDARRQIGSWRAKDTMRNWH